VKDDKQYEGLRKRGASKEKAARIANANAGSSGNKASRRGGSSSSLDDMTKDQLQKRARKIGIKGRSKMSKGELIRAIRNH
jgi:Rho termination factor, N-terminal domain